MKVLIKQHRNEIRQMFKAEIIGIFDSYARGEEKTGSDVDVLVKEMLGIPVDVVSMRVLHPMMRDYMLRELVAL